VTGNTPPTGDQLTHLTSVTVVPVKGKAKTYKVNDHNTFVHSRQLLKDYEQVMLPVDGRNSEGLKIQKLKKVSVTAIENCFATQ
jgi:hypothetical protein